MTIVKIDDREPYDLLFKDDNEDNGDSSVTKEKKVFVDVGGFDGDSTKMALSFNPNLTVIIIEPIKSLCELMKQKFLDNKNVIVVNKAAWCDKGIIQFNEYEGWSKGLSTLQPIMIQLRPEGVLTNRIWKYNVEVDTIDNILAENNIQTVDYVKIDTEGSEEQVLTGFSKYCADTRFHIEHHIINLSNILQKLLEMGIDIEMITTFRDRNLPLHVVGTVIGKFKKK